MTDFLMPSLGADMEAGTLVEWLIKPGDAVKRGDVVAVVETQKGAIEIEIFDSGKVAELVVGIGERVPVGTVMARLAGAGEAPIAAVEPSRPAAVVMPVVTMPPATVPARPAAASTLPATRVAISPAARRLAAERGIGFENLKGTGPGGALTLADIEAAAGTRSPAPPATAPRRTGFDPAAMRQAIAAAMSRSKREIPHYYLTQTVDVSAVMAWLEQANARRPPAERVLPAAVFLRAIALAVARAPELNGFWEDDRFRPAEGIHVGWAVALRGGGLIAPAIHNADQRSIDDLMAALRDLVRRARGSGLRSSELRDATITVTSLGERGAEAVLPIIQPPQVAMLGVGRVVTRPWVVDGAVRARQVITLTLAGDHRASDGHRGGLLLFEAERLLQTPEAL